MAGGEAGRVDAVGTEEAEGTNGSGAAAGVDVGTNEGGAIEVCLDARGGRESGIEVEVELSIISKLSESRVLAGILLMMRECGRGALGWRRWKRSISLLDEVGMSERGIHEFSFSERFFHHSKYS